jgi:hypothetical protein
VTTCGYTTNPPLLCALMVFGADRMLFSVDHPFSDNSQAAFLRDAPLSPADKQRSPTATPSTSSGGDQHSISPGFAFRSPLRTSLPISRRRLVVRRKRAEH